MAHTVNYVSAKRIKAKRIAVTDVSSAFNVTNDTDKVILRNDGSNDVRVNFGADVSTDYFTLKPADATEILTTTANQDINLFTPVSPQTSTIEVIFWGE